MIMFLHITGNYETVEWLPPFQLVKVVESEGEAEDDGEDPEEVEGVVPVWAEDDGTWRLQQDVVSIGRQAPAEEGGAEVHCDGGEPDHEESEHDALAVIAQHQSEVLLLVLRHDGSVVDDGRQEAHSGDRGQAEEGRLQHWVGGDAGR